MTLDFEDKTSLTTSPFHSAVCLVLMSGLNVLCSLCCSWLESKSVWPSSFELLFRCFSFLIINCSLSENMPSLMIVFCCSHYQLAMPVFECRHCGLRCPTPTHLHSLTHSDRRPHFECQVCSCAFTNIPERRLHISAIRRFECEICGKKFTRAGDLKKHISTVHKKERRSSRSPRPRQHPPGSRVLAAEMHRLLHLTRLQFLRSPRQVPHRKLCRIL